MQNIRQSILNRKVKPTGNPGNIESKEKTHEQEVNRIEYKKNHLEKINDHRAKLFLGNREDRREIVYSELPNVRDQIQKDYQSHSELRDQVRQREKAYDDARNKEMIAHRQKAMEADNHRNSQRKAWAQETLNDNIYVLCGVTKA